MEIEEGIKRKLHAEDEILAIYLNIIVYSGNKIYQHNEKNSYAFKIYED